MVNSKTKYEATHEEIRELFAFHKLGQVKNIAPLGNGEFNAAYKVTLDDGKSFALKIAPPEGATVLTYEKNMMESEVFWYKKMHENTDILCPEVYVSDFSKSIIKSNCFIMQMMEGEPLWAVNFSDQEYEKVQKQKIEMLTKIHRIKNDKFGYRQSGLHDTWGEALKSMAGNLVNDCKALGYETPDGERFIECIDKHSEILKNVPCRMVNFDLWDSNVLYKDGKICWIDPERGFWGDPVADFITLGAGQKTPLSAKQKEIDIYNETANEKIVLSKETEIRYAFAVCLLALIEEVEKYVRYEPDEPNYIRNTADARDMYDMAFGIL
ncbi:aminoglycoside phosphotransferase family protein [Butyrivibrio sp. INlla16]|uniref:aminoglycoside phosphotransferase family protein n=1 Tax=Butyrivibrio sp. INlla16 TaxID=1520807 RepID=UPI0008807F2C|nr:aminoglycoside phosphotransferase family protein [Butyrivibrio sp. INlla16]SDB44404.1 Phosphotransferase enzyme family protein [Butyrivibrio sp. INlla16]